MKTNRNMNNREVAQLLRAVAAAYEVKKANQFRITAYQRAAVAVEHATSELKDFWDEGKLEDVPGIGKHIASYLDELFRTGKVNHFREVFRGLPPAMFELMKIPGIGPKTAYKLAKKLSIREAGRAIEKLEKAAKKGKIAGIEGFEQKSQQNILEGIAAVKRGQTKQNRMVLSYADSMAKDILAYLQKCPAVIRSDTLGSLRRMVSTIGDIDIAVATDKPEQVVDWFIRYPGKQTIVEKGKTGATLLLKNGRQVDMRVQRPEAYGAMLQYFTGSKEHNIRLRELALKKGLSLSEYGIKPIMRQKPNLKKKNYNEKLKVYEYESEDEFYQALGLRWIPPELREGGEEIERARLGRLPELVELKDIKGDLHVHSNFPIEESHDPGSQSMEEMVAAAASLGYEYLGFSEHNPSLSQHTNKMIIDLLKAKKEAIDKINYSRTKNLLFRVFNGLEVDIKPNGELAIPPESFDILDYIIVSIHSQFTLNRKKMTERVMRGLNNPKVRIFGHPTGRLLGKREGYELDWQKIFAICREKNIWIEINAWPERLDLPDILVKEAVKNGVKMIINTDSHAADHLKLMTYGVSVARRGWAEKKDIVNVLGYDKIKNII